MSTRYIYLLSCGSFHKVGQTKDIQRRIRDLQTGNAHRVLYVDSFATVQADRDEKEIHRFLYGYRTQGEWFDLPNRLLISRGVWFRPAPQTLPPPPTRDIEVSILDLPW